MAKAQYDELEMMLVHEGDPSNEDLSKIEGEADYTEKEDRFIRDLENNLSYLENNAWEV